jgi:hypothetical protein
VQFSVIVALAKKRSQSANGIAHTDAEVKAEVNRAYREVARLAARYQAVNYTVGSEDITTSNGTQTYALSSDDIRRPFKMDRTDTDTNVPCRQLTEGEIGKFGAKLVDERGKYLYFVTRSAAATPVWTVHFLTDQVPAGTFTIQYIARPDEMSDDTDTPTMVDEDFHDLIAWEAAVSLMSADNSATAFAVMRRDELRRELMFEAAATADPGEVADEYLT